MARAAISIRRLRRFSVGSFTPRTSFDMYFGKRLDETSGYVGLLDEISVYSRALTASEVLSFFNTSTNGKCPPLRNLPPSAFAGADRTIYFPATNSLTLPGAVYDDALPSNLLSVAWSYVSGASTVFFSTMTQAVTTVTFTNTGTYTFRLTASDGELTASNDVVVKGSVMKGSVNGNGAFYRRSFLRNWRDFWLWMGILSRSRWC
jgi:hypothetical protein